MRLRLRLSSLAPGLVGALLVGSLGTPVVAPSPAGAAPPRLSSAAVGQVARSAEAPSASQATTRRYVVDHNIEKRPLAMARALQAARRSGAEVILLQEVCWWQATDLRSSHPEWSIAYTIERERNGCLRRGEGVTQGLRRDVGNIAIWTGGATALTSSHTLRHQRNDADRTGLACVTWLETVQHRACSVHLISPVNTDQIRVRTEQAKDVRAITRPWIERDDLVILGGDFNAQPRRRTMKFLYDYSGAGDFREASTRRLGGRDCRCRQITGDGHRVKVDYIFYSANRLEPRAYRRLRIVKTASDHHLLIGWADVDASAR